MLNNVVSPALRAGKITTQDLLAYLREAEEFGSQHVFLYMRSKMHRQLPEQREIRSWLRELDAEHVLDSPILVEKPDSPTVTEVRYESLPSGDALTVKIIETRTYDTFLRRVDRADGRYSREYQIEQVRAASVVRIHSSGLVECRIDRHRNASRNYNDELNGLLAAVAPILDPKRYAPLSLVTAKNVLYEQRAELQNVVSFSRSLLRNSNGVNITAACAPSESLFDDRGTDRGLATFVKESEGYYDSHNVKWLKQLSGRPSEDINVMLSGQVNEFAVIPHCSRADYEHILSEIRRFNR